MSSVLIINLIPFPSGCPVHLNASVFPDFASDHSTTINEYMYMYGVPRPNNDL